MNNVRLLISLILTIVGTVVALRYRTLRQLEVEQTQLRQQVEQATELRAVIAQKKQTTTIASTDAAMSNAEHLELLRLRNEIGQLRRELAAESNQMMIQAAKLGDRPVPVSASTPGRGVMTKAQAVVKVNHGKQLSLGLLLYVSENGGVFPTTLVDVVRYVPRAENADDFELLVNGEMTAIRRPGQTIAFREKQPWQTSSGKWGRVYGFADGHVEVAYSATEDFTEWERRKAEISPVAAK